MLLSLSGCVLDPFQRPGTWSMTGASREDIAQQAANPADLISGRSEPSSNGVAAVAGVDKALGANGAGTAAGLQTPVSPTSVFVSTGVGN
jgi:hypothetical protein